MIAPATNPRRGTIRLALALAAAAWLVLGPAAEAARALIQGIPA